MASNATMAAWHCINTIQLTQNIVNSQRLYNCGPEILCSQQANFQLLFSQIKIMQNINIFSKFSAKIP